MKMLILLIVLCGFKCSLGQSTPYLKRKKAQKDSMYQAGRKRFYSEEEFKYTVYFGEFHCYSDKPFITTKSASDIDSLVLASKKNCMLIAKGYNVISFSILIAYKGKIIELSSNSNKLTEEMKNYIRKLENDSNLIFHKIIGVNPERKNIKLGSLVLKINNNI